MQAATESLKIQVDDCTGDKEQTAKRQSMLEEIEREFEAATKSLEQLQASDFNKGSDDDEPSAERKSMLEEIEREFEAAINDLKQIKVDDSKSNEEQAAKRMRILEVIEREFEEVQSGFSATANKQESAKKQSGSSAPDFLGLGQSGVCGWSSTCSEESAPKEEEAHLQQEVTRLLSLC